MTTATWSPTWRTRSVTSGGCGGPARRRAVLRVDLPAAGQPADPVRGHVFAGINGHDPRCRGSGGGIDTGDPRIGVRAAQDVGVELSRPVDVVGVGALA